MADPEWAGVTLVGLSATPWARAMGRHWQELIQPVSIGELIDAGFLCKFTVYAPPSPDLGEVRTTAGEFSEADLSRACDRPELVGDVIATWQRRAERRPTLTYAVDRPHARHLCERFIEAGVPTEYIDCDTPLFEREEVFERFKSGNTIAICNVATLDNGHRPPQRRMPNRCAADEVQNSVRADHRPRSSHCSRQGSADRFGSRRKRAAPRPRDGRRLWSWRRFVSGCSSSYISLRRCVSLARSASRRLYELFGCDAVSHGLMRGKT
jgi:hypothetical protein